MRSRRNSVDFRTNWTGWKSSWRVPTTQNSYTRCIASNTISDMRQTNQPHPRPFLQRVLEVSAERSLETLLFPFGVQYEAREIRPSARFVFLSHLPVPGFGFRSPSKGGAERPVGILE